MNEHKPDGISPADRVEDVTRILHEMTKAVQEALTRHKQAGDPVAVWRDGRVVWVPPEQIPTFTRHPLRK